MKRALRLRDIAPLFGLRNRATSCPFFSQNYIEAVTAPAAFLPSFSLARSGDPVALSGDTQLPRHDTNWKVLPPLSNSMQGTTNYGLPLAISSHRWCRNSTSSGGIISFHRPHVPPRGATVYVRRSARLENSNAMPRSGGAVEVLIHMSYLRGSYSRTRMSARRSMRVYEGGTHVCKITVSMTEAN